MITNKDIEILSGIVGEERVSTEETELFCYSRDLGNSIPDELLKAYGMLGAEVVMLPKSTEEISSILEYASKKNIPVTTRGGGSWALGGVLPMDGGVVLDMCRMNNIKTINKEDSYVEVEAGITWKRLMDSLTKYNLMIASHPSSAVSATIGGFIATGGAAGTGVPKYGVVGDQILSLTVVLSNGKVIRTNPWEIWTFIGSEGTLGIVTEATIKVFPLQEEKHYLYYFDSVEQGTEALKKLSQINPYQLSFLNRGFLSLLIQAGEDFLERELSVSIGVVGTEEEIIEKDSKIKEICKAGVTQSERVAIDEFKNRFKIGLAFKCLGPSLFVQEIRVPFRFLQNVLKDIAKLLEGLIWGIESLGSDRGSIVLSIMILGDERRELEYLQTFSLSAAFATIARKYCGSVYGIGLHNAVNMQSIHKEGLGVMRDIRSTIDNSNILNPGKTTHPRIPGVFVFMFMFMMKNVPFLVRFILDTMKYIPVGFLRFIFRIVGGNIK